MRLHQYLDRAPPFDWRRHNCAHFAAGWAAPAALVDVLARLPMPEGPGPMGARAALRALGVDTLRAAVTRVLGVPELPTPALAQPGDVVLVGKRCLGLCNGRHAALLDAAGDIAYVDMSAVDAAWRAAR